MAAEAPKFPNLEFVYETGAGDCTPFSFNPLDGKYPGQEDTSAGAGLMVTPNDLYLRWYPGKFYDTHESHYEDDPEVIIKTAREHREKLASFGITIASHGHVVGYAPDSKALALYTYARRVEGEEVDIDNPRHLEIMKTTIFPALAGYFEWVLNTSQPFYLHDLNIPGQYIITSAAEGETEVVLVDLDPFIVRLYAPKDKTLNGLHQLKSDISELYQFFSEDDTERNAIADSLYKHVYDRINQLI